MNIFLKNRILTAALFAAVVTLGACGFSPGTGDVVRLGYLQNDLHHLPAFVALEKGYFEQAGLQAEVSGVFRAGPEEMSAFAAGELDIGYVGQAPATAAVLNGIADIVFVAQVNLEGSAIVAGKDTGITSMEGLRGRTVAMPGHATMQDFLLRKALRSGGIPFDMMKHIVLKPPEMKTALDQGSIDAFIAWEPYPSQAVNSGSGTIIADSRTIWPEHPCCVLVATRVFSTKHPDRIVTIRKIHRKACRFIGEHPAEAINIGMKYTGMKRETIVKALGNIHYTDRVDPAKAGEFVDFLHDLRYIRPQANTPSPGDFILAE